MYVCTQTTFYDPGIRWDKVPLRFFCSSTGVSLLYSIIIAIDSSYCPKSAILLQRINQTRRVVVLSSCRCLCRPQLLLEGWIREDRRLLRTFIEGTQVNL